MSGEGHIADMITRMKNNEATRQERKARQKKLNDAYREGKGANPHIKLTEEVIAPETMDVLKNDIRRKASSERKSQLIETIATTAIILLIIALAFVLIV
jgi:hypothetical protein